VSQPTKIIPFPIARRRAFVSKHAARMAVLSSTRADIHLRQQLQVQVDTMRRRGIAESEIVREIRSLEAAIRAELWRSVITPQEPKL
jgi:Family of unknown function (DUF6074)